jgi:hypothetical protein
MENKPVKTQRKKTSRGQRKHVRRVKQEARKISLPDSQMKKTTRTSEAPKEQVQRP